MTILPFEHRRLLCKVESERIEKKDRSFEVVVELVMRVYDRIVQTMGAEPRAVGVGQPGHVGADGEIGGLASFPEWGDGMLPLRQRLSEKMRCGQVTVLDDANAALLAEAQYYQEAKTLCMITIGTGIGTSVCFRNGEVVLNLIIFLT